MRFHKLLKWERQILSGIITTKCANRNPKLILNFSVEGLENRKQLRSIFYQKGPSASGIIINLTDKVTESQGGTDPTRTPNI